MGKASSVKLNTFSAKNVVEALSNHPINAETVSVWGCFHHFISVGIAANISLIIAKIIVIVGSFVSHHNSSANAEEMPQI